MDTIDELARRLEAAARRLAATAPDAENDEVQELESDEDNRRA